MSKKTKYMLIFLSLCFYNTLLFSQPNLFRFKHLTVSQGLSQNTVNAIAQDQYGFIWFGTDNGLNRYDGYSIKHFLHDKTNPGSISNDQVIALNSDSKGRLWIGTQSGGLNRYDYNTQTFIKYIDSDTIKVRSKDITSIFEDLSENIWVGTRYGFKKYIDSTDTFISYYNYNNCSNCLSENIINSIHSSSKKHIWIGTNGGGINKFDIATETFTVFNKEQKI